MMLISPDPLVREGRRKRKGNETFHLGRDAFIEQNRVSESRQRRTGEKGQRGIIIAAERARGSDGGGKKLLMIFLKKKRRENAI